MTRPCIGCRVGGPISAVLTSSLLLLAGCGGTVPGTATSDTSGARTSPGAQHAVLMATWEGYKRAFIPDSGRVTDPRRGGETTSEGESYALLRAVWIDDRPTFDAVWQWTRAHLRTRGDALLSWLWHSDGGGGNVVDAHSAADADEDTALALLMAGTRWADATDVVEGRRMLADIWNKEVAMVRGRPYLTAGDWAAAQADPGPVINPSYLAPYAYRVFARVDAAHDWTALVTTSYEVLDACTHAPLQEGRSVGLPPNWCALDRASGSAVPFPAIIGADDYGFDAFRVMWRVAVDAHWFAARQARDFLVSEGFLRSRWKQDGHLDAVYAHDGGDRQPSENLAVLGGDLGAFLGIDDAAATRILDGRLLSVVIHDSATAAHFDDARDYYEQNWAWFGVALASDSLPNLTLTG